MLISYREWLDQTSPEGGGDIWHTRSNVDLDFGKSGIRSKNFKTDNKEKTKKINPEKLFFGKSNSCGDQ